MQKVLMLLWISLQMGGFGTRSRRGFGNLTIAKPFEFEFQDIGKFYFRNQYDSKDDYENKMKSNFSILQKAFKIDNKGYRLYLSETGDKENGNGKWKETLSRAGIVMQAFRAFSDPDYTKIVKERYKSIESCERAAFGLPLKFTLNPNTKESVTIKNLDNDQKESRFSSPVILSITKIGNSWHSQYLILDFDYNMLNIDINKNKIKTDASAIKCFEEHLINPDNHQHKGKPMVSFDKEKCKYKKIDLFS